MNTRVVRNRFPGMYVAIELGRTATGFARGGGLFRTGGKVTARKCISG